MEKIIKRINIILIISIIVILPLGVIPRIQISGFVKVSLSDILAFLIAINFLISLLTSKVKVPEIFKNFIPFLILALFSLILSLRLFPYNEVLTGGLYFVRLILYSSIIPAVYNLTAIQKKKIVFLLLMSGLITAIFGVIQYFLYPDLRNLYYLGFDPHYKRIFGTYGDPNFIGLIFVLTLLLSFYKASHSREKEKIFYLLSGMFVFLALAFTYSRSSWLALVISSLVYGIIRKRWPIFIATVVMILIAAFMLPRPGGEGVRLGRTASTLARVDNFRESLEIFTNNPVFGVGFDNYRVAKRKAGLINEEEFSFSHSASGADNSLMFILVTTGICGLVAFGYFLYRVFRTGDIFIIVTVGGWLVHSLFVNSLFFIPILVWMLVFLGLRVMDYN